MGNKTIYVQDEAMWKRAKKLAGKAGLSGVIAKALRDFVERRDEGLERLQFKVAEGAGPDSVSDVIAFDGKLLASAELEVSSDGPLAYSFVVKVYLTKGGKLVLIGLQAPDDGALYWNSYDKLRALREDPFLEPATNESRSRLLRQVRQALGKEFVHQID
jgi:hypothetical protein